MTVKSGSGSKFIGHIKILTDQEAKITDISKGYRKYFFWVHTEIGHLFAVFIL